MTIFDKLPVVDQRGARATRASLGVQILSIHAVFGKIWQNCMLVKENWQLPLGKILDPALATMLLAILDISHYQKSQKGCHGSMIKNRDLQQKPYTLSLCQSSTGICYSPSWLSTITRNHKNGYHGSTIEDRDCNNN